MTDATKRMPARDEPRLDFERLLEQLIERAHEVFSTQARLRALLEANRSMVEHIDLPTVLRRIVAAAVELVDASHGAIELTAADGSLEAFIHTGMADSAVAALRGLPDDRGGLADPVPTGLESLLGVPLRVRDEVFGSLYLIDHHDGAFSSADEDLVLALAATAGTIGELGSFLARETEASTPVVAPDSLAGLSVPAVLNGKPAG